MRDEYVKLHPVIYLCLGLITGSVMVISYKLAQLLELTVAVIKAIGNR